MGPLSLLLLIARFHVFPYVTIAAIAVVGLGLVLRYFGPRLKSPPIYGPPGPRPRELFVAEAGNNAISVYAIDAQGFLQSPALRRIVDDPAQNPVTRLVAPYDIFVDSQNAFVLNDVVDPEGDVIPEVDAIVIFESDKNGPVQPDSTWLQTTFSPTVFSCITVSRAPDSLLLGVNKLNPMVMQLDKFPRRQTIMTNREHCRTTSSSSFPASPPANLPFM